MQGKIWPTREQIYAAKSVLPIEHPAAVTGYGRDVETGRKNIGQEFAGESRDDLTKKLLNRLQRLRKADRENTTLDERVRRSIVLDLVEIIKDEEPDDRDKEGIRAALSDLDARKLDRVVNLIKELWPTYCVLPRRFGEPPSSPSAVAKKTPSEPVIDHLANGDPVNGAEMAMLDGQYFRRSQTSRGMSRPLGIMHSPRPSTFRPSRSQTILGNSASRLSLRCWCRRAGPTASAGCHYRSAEGRSGINPSALSTRGSRDEIGAVRARHEQLAQHTGENRALDSKLKATPLQQRI